MELKGSRTEQNLQTAFAGESQARNKYTYFANKARQEGMNQIAEIFEVAGIETEIIAASVRNPIHITDCALAGADIATVPYKVIEQMTHHPLTDAGIKKFQEDYIAVFGE